MMPICREKSGRPDLNRGPHRPELWAKSTPRRKSPGNPLLRSAPPPLRYSDFAVDPGAFQASLREAVKRLAPKPEGITAATNNEVLCDPTGRDLRHRLCWFSAPRVSRRRSSSRTPARSSGRWPSANGATGGAPCARLKAKYCRQVDRAIRRALRRTSERSRRVGASCSKTVRAFRYNSWTNQRNGVEWKVSHDSAYETTILHLTSQ